MNQDVRCHLAAMIPLPTANGRKMAARHTGRGAYTLAVMPPTTSARRSAAPTARVRARTKGHEEASADGFSGFPDEAIQFLLELQAEHERLMQRVGLEPEGRKYTPHVTLARLRDTSSFEVAEYLSARCAFRSPPFTVSRFVLFSSRASVGGGPYVVEAAYPLAA